MTQSKTGHKDKEKTPLSFARSVVSYLVLTAIIFLTAWLWLTTQLESMLELKVEETGRQLTRVAAIASAEAVIAEDQVYLQKLVDELNKERFINKVSIFRIDGTLLVQSASKESATNKTVKPQGLKQWLTGHLPLYFNDNYPFMVEITWESTSVGWFQIIINRQQLESSIRDSSFQITLLTLIGYLLFSIIGLVYLWRQHRAIRNYLQTVQETQKAKVQIKDINSLDGAATAVKEKDELAKQLQFKSVALKAQNSKDSPSRDYREFVQLYRIQVSDEEAYKTKLDTIKKWQELLFEAASLYELEATIVRDQQIFLIIPKPKVESGIKLALLIHQVQLRLADQCHQVGSCFMRMGQEDVVLKKVNPFYCLVEGDHFKQFENNLFQQKSFGWLSKGVAESITLKEQGDDGLSSGFMIENHPEQSIKIEVEQMSLIERHSQNLIAKFFPSFSDTNN